MANLGRGDSDKKAADYPRHLTCFLKLYAKKLKRTTKAVNIFLLPHYATVSNQAEECLC